MTIMDDETTDKSKEFVKVLKAAASANRDLVFAYVGVKQWEEFTESFEVYKKTALPKMIVWDGDEQYFSVSVFFTIYFPHFLQKANIYAPCRLILLST